VGGARRARPPLFWGKNKGITEIRKAGRTGKTKLPSLPPSLHVAQGLDLPLQMLLLDSHT